jgi:SAM-dependent methyltransferase
MTRAPNTPPPLPSAAPSPARNTDAGAVPESDAAVPHDHTLKWVLSDHMDLGETPEPVAQPVAAPLKFVVRQGAPEAVTLPQGAKTPPPYNYSLTEQTPVPPKEPATSPSPTADVPVAKAPPAEVVPPSPAQTSPSKVAPEGSTPEMPYLGATPSDFFTSVPTPPAPSVQVPPQEVGAAPVAMVPGPGGSDAELSADSVELLTPATDESAPPAEEKPVEEAGAQEAVEKQSPVAEAAADAAEPQGSEAREVEPEAVMIMADSSEHTLETTGPPPQPVSTGTTPPPVPQEALSISQRPASPEKTAPRVTAETTTPPKRAPEAPGAVRKPPEQPATTTSHAPSEAAAPAASAPTSSTIAATLFDEYQTPSSSGDGLPEALARRSLQKRSKPWYEEVFDDDYLRTVPFMTPDQTTREVSFIRDALAVRAGGEVLDVACGYGRHAIELAHQGFQVTGLDLSLPLLIKAADHAQKRGLSVNFVHADMRKMAFNAQFDAAYCVLSSFGYFDEETNLRVATAICRALKPGGRFLLDIINRDYVVGGLPSRVWWEGDGCVVLEEVDFNYHTSRVLIRRSVVFGNGRQSEQELSMRAYSLHEVGRLLRQAGLRVLEVSGGLATKSWFFGSASRNIIAVCERPTA